MKARSILLSALVAVAAVPAHAEVPPVDPVGKSALTACPTTLAAPKIYHFDKVIFILAPGALTPAVAADGAALNALPRSTELDIKINDDPATVAELEGKVLTFLGALPNAGNRALLRITDVEYASVVCPKGAVVLP